MQYYLLGLTFGCEGMRIDADQVTKLQLGRINEFNSSIVQHGDYCNNKFEDCLSGCYVYS